MVNISCTENQFRHLIKTVKALLLHSMGIMIEFFSRAKPFHRSISAAAIYGAPSRLELPAQKQGGKE